MTTPVQINVLAGLQGLDTSAYSVGYIAGWADGDTAAITDTAQTVLKCVHELADALDAHDAQQSTETGSESGSAA